MNSWNQLPAVRDKDWGESIVTRGQEIENPPISKKSSEPNIRPSAVVRKSRVTSRRKNNREDFPIPKKTAEPKDDTALLMKALSKSASELARSRGYRVTGNTSTGLDMIVSRLVEVSNNSFIVDLILFRISNKGDVIKYSEICGGAPQGTEGENGSVSESSNELAEQVKRTVASLSKANRTSKNARINASPSSLVEGLESFSVNMLLGKINYSRLDGRSVEFWANPVLLTSSRLEDQTGNSVPWIPIPTRVAKSSVDLVNATSLSSYLDFRDREVRILGRELLLNEGDRQRLPDALRLFRILSVCVSVVLIATFIVFVLNGAVNSLAALLALGLAASVEVLVGLKLIKRYRSLQRNNELTQEGSPSISAEQIVKVEKEFPPYERPFLYWKYGGADLSKLRKETNLQRIDELENRSKEIVNRTIELENDELYCEAILSYDRALRAAITAVFITMGIDTEGNEIEESFPILTKLFEGIKLEEIRYVKALRDRVNRGYDATKNDEERVRDIAAPLISQSLELLRSCQTKGSSQTISLLRAPPTSATYSDPATQISRYQGRLRSLISAAYSAKDNSETRTFLNKLKQAVATATCIKIIQLTGRIPTSLTITELLKQLENSRGKPIQQDEEEILEWIGRLKEGKIKTDEDINEFENQCISFLHSLKVLGEPTGMDNPRVILNAQDSKPVPSYPTNNSATREGSLGEEATQKAQEQVTPKLPISKDILDTTSSLKFLLDASEDNELLEIGPGGASLLKAKKELRRDAETKRSKPAKEPKKAATTPTDLGGVYPKTDKANPTESAKPMTLSGELTSITDSLDHPQDRIGQAESTGGTNDTTSDTVGALPMVMPFENLGDFKRAIFSGVLPTLVAYLSDDEPSRDVGNVMDQLAEKYHGRVTFLSVDSRFRDIAIESKIKSYPTVLMFRKDKTIVELKSLEPDQLENELIELLEPKQNTVVKGETHEEVISPRGDHEVETEMEQGRDKDKISGGS